MGAKVPQYPPPGSKPPSTPPPPPPPRPPSGFGLIGLVGARPCSAIHDLSDYTIDAISVPTCCDECGRLYSVIPQLTEGFRCLLCGGPAYDPWSYIRPKGDEVGAVAFGILALLVACGSGIVVVFYL